MEKITKLSNFKNKLLLNNEVFLCKSIARDFLIFCKMIEQPVKFELFNNKIRFFI